MIFTYVTCFVMSMMTVYFLTKFLVWLTNKGKLTFLVFNKRDARKSSVLMGGVVLLISIFANTLLLTSTVSTEFKVGLFGAVVMVIFAMLGESYRWNGGAKLVAQVVVVSVVILGGVSIDYLTFPFISKVVLFSPVESFIVTLVWMLVIINMFNLIDGLDGLASGVSAIAAVMLFFISLTVSPVFVLFLLLSMAGSTLAFLRFNFYPAAISLGNSGAFLLGYLFAFCSVLGIMKSTLSFTILFFVFALPFMDIGLSIIRRLIKKQSIFSADLLHIHHQLVRRGVSERRAVLTLYVMSGCFGSVAFLMSLEYSRPIQTICAAVILVLVFGYFGVLQTSVGKSMKQRT